MILNQSIIDQLKKRDEATFDKLYHETKRGVYAMIFSHTKNHGVTEDLMQEVYMKMLIKIDQYRVGSNFMNWLLQISKNLAIDYYRMNKKVIPIDDDVIQQTFQSDEESPEQKDQFENMMSCLDEQEREIILLKIVDERSHQEIAKIIGRPLGTVLWIYQKAITKLKKYGGDVL